MSKRQRKQAKAAITGAAMSAPSFTPTHGSASPCREQVTVRICVGIRGRAHRCIIGFNRPSTLNLARTQSVAPLSSGCGNWIAIGSSPRWRKLAGSLKRFFSVAHRSRPFLPTRRDMWSGILNLRGGFKALRSLSFRSRIKFCQEPSRGVFQAFSLSPVLSSCAAHVVNSSNGVGACPTKEFPKLERVFPRIA